MSEKTFLENLENTVKIRVTIARADARLVRCARASFFFQTRALWREARVSSSSTGILKRLESHINFSNNRQPFINDLVRQLNCLRFNSFRA